MHSVLRPISLVGTPRARLVCLPYAGAAASLFQRWATSFPRDVEVLAADLPARQGRWKEAALTRVTPIVDELAVALGALPPLPTALFGHSFGALVAFALAQRLQEAGTPPRALIAAAMSAPHLPLDRPPIHALPDADFLRGIHLYCGTPRDILDNRDLMELALPALRADFEALETYGHRSSAPLDVPVTVLRGRRDLHHPAARAQAWTELTASGCALHEVDGGHFFVDTHREWVLERVREVLARDLPHAAPAC